MTSGIKMPAHHSPYRYSTVCSAAGARHFCHAPSEMHRGNLWGGPLEIWTGTNDKKKATTLRGGDLDPSAYSYKSSRAAAESDKNFLLEGWRMRGREDARRGKQVDLGFFVVSRRALFWTIGLVVGLAVVVVLLKIIISNFPLQPRVTPEDGYTVALRKALLFFDAQMSGVLPKNNSVSWRGNSGMKDGLCDNTVHNDLVGGFYDAGDAIKFNFPASFSITILSWSVIEYGNKYKAAGQLNHVMKIIKWGTDYILKTFNSSAGTIDKIVTQVGVGNTADKTPNDHYCWMRPEDMDYPRPVSICHACSDLAAEMASALAAAAIVFRDDGTYSKLLIDGAEKLWHFARNRRSTYSIDVDAMHFYNSTGYWDEFIWGGAWLYYATGNDSYLTMLANDLEFAKTAGNIWSNHDYRVFSWDSKLPGAQVLLTRLRVFVGPGYPFEEVLKTLHNLTDISMCSYLPIFSSSKRTKGGLILLNHGGSRPLQYVVNVAFLASLYSDYLEALSVPGWFCGPNFYSLDVLREFAKTQIDYILGRNPKNLSYVVGIGDRYPVHVHHRGASIPPDDIRYNCTEGWKWRDSKMPNPNLLVGAMVSGPDMNDKFQDVRTKQKYTEPTLAGNSGLVAALVSLSGDKSALDTNSMFSSVVQDKLPPPPPAPWHP